MHGRRRRSRRPYPACSLRLARSPSPPLRCGVPLGDGKHQPRARPEKRTPAPKQHEAHIHVCRLSPVVSVAIEVDGAEAALAYLLLEHHGGRRPGGRRRLDSGGARTRGGHPPSVHPGQARLALMTVGLAMPGRGLPRAIRGCHRRHSVASPAGVSQPPLVVGGRIMVCRNLFVRGRLRRRALRAERHTGRAAEAEACLWTRTH